MRTKLILCYLSMCLFSSSLFGAAEDPYEQADPYGQVDPYHLTGLREWFILTTFERLISPKSNSIQSDESPLMQDKRTIGFQEFYDSFLSVYRERQEKLPLVNRYSQTCCNTCLHCTDGISESCSSGCRALLKDRSNYWAIGGCAAGGFEQIIPGLILYLIGTQATFVAQGTLSGALFCGGFLLSVAHKAIRYCWNAANDDLDPVASEGVIQKHSYHDATKELLRIISDETKEKIRTLLVNNTDLLFDDKFEKMLIEVNMINKAQTLDDHDS